MLTSARSQSAARSRPSRSAPLLQGFEHALEGDLAVRALDQLGDLGPVDAFPGAEVEREPTARTEVRGPVEAAVLEQRRPLFGLGLEDDAPRSVLGAGEHREQLLAGA